MELRQLEYFVAVAEEQSFTRGAERVQISQPGISSQIRQLERELGTPLFDRSGRNASLTPVGKAVLGRAKDTLVSVRAIQIAVDQVTGLIRGELAIGMVTACTVTMLFDALSTFHVAHPNVRVTLTEDSSNALIQQVRDGSLDLALIGASDDLPYALDTLLIASERLVVLVPRDHEMAGRSSVTLQDLRGHPVICMPAGTGIRTVFDRACVAQNVRLDVTFQASAPVAVANLALRGLGVAILTESIASVYADQAAAVALAEVDTPASLVLIWKADSPALQAFLSHVRTASLALE